MKKIDFYLEKGGLNRLYVGYRYGSGG